MAAPKTEAKKSFFKADYKESKDKKSSEKEKNIREMYESLTGIQKASIVLVSLGTTASSMVFSKLADEDIEQLSTEVAKTDKVDPSVKELVLQEFNELLLAQKFVAQGGLDFAERVLVDAVGKERALAIMEKVKSSIQKTGFDLLNEVDPAQVVNLLQNEHPQTIALLLAHLRPNKAAAVLSSLSPDLQVDVAVRIATMKRIAPDVLDQIESVLLNQIKGLAGGAGREIGGVKSIAEIMNMADMATEKNVLGTLERDNPELATTIKNLMFVFEDIILIDDRGIQRILREIDTKDLSLALKGTSDELKDKFLKNMSSRAAEMITEEMEYMGPVRVKDVEDAQQKIIEVVRRLEEEGEIIISGRGGENDLVL